MRFGVILWAFAAAAAPPDGARFLKWDEVREVVRQFPDAPAQETWEGWVRATDAAVRERVQRGAEDSVTNLLLYGTSFTRLPPASGNTDDPKPRVKALAAALAGSPANERVRMAQEVLKVKGEGPAEIEKVLTRNLTRFTEEQAAYEARLRTANAGGQDAVLAARATLYSDRGLSSDTSLLPNWGIEDTLLAMRRRGVELERIRDVAIIGPGLDFADKRDGFDFYPVQTVQPFALLETAVRLGHADARVTAFDVNPAVLAHLKRLGRSPYRIVLPRDPEMEWNAPIVAYWKEFGTRIGSVVPAVAPPGALARLEVRALTVQPELAGRVSGADLDIVAQTVEEQFDLMVATNILVYYDRLKQAIALANVARMLRPGGVFISNTVLPAQRPAGLKFLGRRSVSYSDARKYGDDFVVYRKEGR
jgi:hypothetical protein